MKKLTALLIAIFLCQLSLADIAVTESFDAMGRRTAQTDVERALFALVDDAAGTAHGVDGIADHLRAQLRILVAYLPVGLVVQSHPVPAACLLGQRGQLVAGLGEHVLQLAQAGGVRRCQFQTDAQMNIHI